MKLITIIFAWIASLFSVKKPIDPIVGYVMSTPTIEAVTPTVTATPTKKIIKLTPTVVKVVVKKVGDTSPWGVAQQIGKDTWTMKVGEDARMATPSEILTALNAYRIRRGSQPLTWNTNLANYAQSRADYLESIHNTDGHKGFEDYLNNQDGFNKLGFTWVGENICYGYRMEAVHMIEWLYAGDKPHDDNQINNRWNYVGIGVNGTANSIIFGTGKR